MSRLLRSGQEPVQEPLAGQLLLLHLPLPVDVVPALVVVAPAGPGVQHLAHLGVPGDRLTVGQTRREGRLRLFICGDCAVLETQQGSRVMTDRPPANFTTLRSPPIMCGQDTSSIIAHSPDTHPLRCHNSCVTCHMSHKLLLFILTKWWG